MKGNREEEELLSASGNFTGSLIAKVGGKPDTVSETILATVFFIPG